ncbi:MAG: putative Ig domain-containing protein [Rickettsiales bacterium]
MSILLPDRHGKLNATDDSRLEFDASDASLRGFLKDTYGVLIIGVGSPWLSQDFYSEGDGANSNFGVFELFGNITSASPGYVGLQFNSYARASNASTFQFQFRPNGGSQGVLTVYSAAVTETNCAYVVVERSGDDYAIHLYDHLGVKTAGTPVTHASGSLGATLRSSAYTVYVGGMDAAFPVTTFPQWNNHLENFALVEQSSAFTSLDSKIQNIIQGGSVVSEFGVSNVKIWRTLKDLSASSLSAEPTATNDIYPSLVNPATSRASLGSPLGAVDTTASCSITERKYNFVGIQGETITDDIPISGTYIGSVTSVECRLLDRDTLAEVVGWTVIDAAPSGGTWSGSFSGVSAGEYCMECRPSNAPSNVFEGRNPWVLAPIFLIVGQSQNAIALNAKSSTITLDSVPSGFKGYQVGVNQNSTYGLQPYVMKAEDEDDFSDGPRYAQIEWERLHPGVPVVWVAHSHAGTGVQDWLDDDPLSGAYALFGDGVNWGTGLATDVRLALGTNKVNIILSWGTNDLPTSDYGNRLEGYIFNTGTGYTGASYKHLTDLYSSDFGFGHTPLTRAITVVTDNFTADPVADDYLNSANFREDQLSIIQAWDAAKTNKFAYGPSVNDMVIEAVGGPHQPDEGEGQDAYIGGSPRLGARWGIAASYVRSSASYTLPSLPDEGTFTGAARSSFTLPVDVGSYGALKNSDATTDVSGFEISEDSGGTWNRKGFSVSYSGNTVTITKDSGDWSALADTVLRWRYHKGGPYSYGTNYTAEMRADINKALYAAAANEDGRGIPVTEKTNTGAGFQVVENVTPTAPVFDSPAYNNLASYNYGDSVTLTPQFSTAGNPAPTYSVVSGSLPSGTSLNTSTGVVSGNLNVNGAVSFTIRATNSEGSSDGAVSFTVTATAPVFATPAYNNSADYDYGDALSISPQIDTAGNPAQTYSLLSGTPPTGYLLDTNTGVITVGAMNQVDSFSFTIRASNLAGNSDGLIVFDVNAIAPVFDAPGYNNLATYDDGDAISIGPQFTTAPLPSATYSITSGSLPTGLSLNTSTGNISGTLDASGAQSFTVQATNSDGGDTTTVAFDVNAAPDVIYSPSSKYLVSTALSILPTVNKGFPAPTYSVFSGSLPAGLSLNTSTGEISGSTAILGVVSVTIRATNSEGTDDTPVSFEIVSELPSGAGGLGLSVGLGIFI